MSNLQKEQKNFQFHAKKMISNYMKNSQAKLRNYKKNKFALMIQISRPCYQKMKIYKKQLVIHF